MYETIALDIFGAGPIKDRAPPSEFRIFRAGENATEKGTFLYDAESENAVLSHVKARGVDLPLDYNHAMLGAAHSTDPSQSGKAAGWLSLEARGGELWASNVRWTPTAHAALSAGEWRYISPALNYDPDTRRVTSLLNVALTNIPATHGLDPLVKLGAEAREQKDSMDKAFLVALGLAVDATTGDAMTRIALLNAVVSELETVTGARGRESLGIVRAWQSGCARAPELAAELAKRDAVEVRREIDAAVSAGKLVPAMREWAEKYGAENPAGLRAFLSALPVTVKMGAEQKPSADPSVAAVALSITPEERRVARMLQIKPEDLAKTRAALASREDGE